MPSYGRIQHWETPHGVIETPLFMPVGTQATVKGVSPRALRELGASVILANTYHLSLRPGAEVIRALGGLHRFMGWDGPILTDSGGFQVYSLAKLRRVDDEGVWFRSHVDGAEHFLTPEKVIEFQRDLGSDLWMPLDECLPYPSDRGPTEEAVRRTTAWARRSRARYRALLNEREEAGRPLLFGIVQGGMDTKLRRRSAEELVAMDLDGYAIGGLCVGEPLPLTFEILEATLEYLPKEKPRYFMGLGTPEEIRRCVHLGVDLFDSVVPTRLARHGSALTEGETRHLKNTEFLQDAGPIEAACTCYACTNFSRAYLRHLLLANEMLGMTLLSIHNLSFMMRTISAIKGELQPASLQEVLR